MNTVKPNYAIAIQMRKEDKELDAKFALLPEADKWKWLEFATHSSPTQSMVYAHRLVEASITVAE